MKTLLAMLFLSMPLYLMAQSFPMASPPVQMGSDILGEAAQDQMAPLAISGNGMRLAAGAPENDGVGEKAGHVRIFEWTEGSWVQMGADIEGSAALDNSGEAVSLSDDGSVLAIGAPYNNANGYACGQVRIFQWQDTEWVQRGLDIYGPEANLALGKSVSLSGDGNRVAIGAPHTEPSGLYPAGQVYVYDWNGNAWEQVGATLEGYLSRDAFGYRVSLSEDGNRLAIGAPYRITPPYYELSSGYVQIYDWNGAGWEQVGSDLQGILKDEKFGCAVSLSDRGNRVAVGAMYYSPSNNFLTGKATTYEWVEGDWVRIGNNITGPGPGDEAGSAVSLSADGNRLVVGSRVYYNPATQENALGLVRVFDWSNAQNKWLEPEDEFGNKIGRIEGDNPNDWAGVSAMLSKDGFRLAFGAPFNDDNGNSSGKIKVFDISLISHTRTRPEVEFEIFPNPVSDVLYIKGIEPTAIWITDGLGRVVYQTDDPDPVLQIGFIPEGIYFLRLQVDDQWGVSKFVKQ